LADEALLRRLEALEKQAEACHCWRLAADLSFSRIEEEIDAVDDSITGRIRSMEDRRSM
jgi:hypothetical protein